MESYMVVIKKNILDESIAAHLILPRLVVLVLVLSKSNLKATSAQKILKIFIKTKIAITMAIFKIFANYHSNPT